ETIARREPREAADDVPVLRQPARVAARRRHDEQVVSDAVAALIGDPSSIGRPPWIAMVAGYRRKDRARVGAVERGGDELNSSVEQRETREPPAPAHVPTVDRADDPPR